MKYPRIYQRLFCEPWMLNSPVYLNMCEIFNAVILGTHNPDMAVEGLGAKDGFKFMKIGDTAIIPIQGVMGKHLDSFDMMSGGCSCDLISDRLDESMDDPNIKEIILRVDSPGGNAIGIPELANKVHRIATGSEKSVVTFTDSIMGSAAYYVASQSNYIYATQSAIVGSIGAIATVVDRSKQFEDAGIKFQIIKSAPLKDMGSPSRPLEAEELELIQSRIDAIGQRFQDAVHRVRPDVPEEAMNGDAFDVTEIMDRKLDLVDEVVDSIDALFSRSVDTLL